MNTRLPNWSTLLVEFIAQHRCMPFAWGSQDCCQFGRKAVHRLRGKDPTKGRRLGLRRYHTAAAAAKTLARLGGVEALPGRCGLVEISLVRASRGDLVLLELEGRPALGVCVGEKAAFPGKDGLVFHPTLSSRRAWRV